MRNKLLSAVKLLLGVALLILLFYKVGPANILSTLLEIRLQTILIVILIYVFAVILVAANYTLFLSVDYPNIKFVNVLRRSLETWALGLFMPSKSGDFLLPFLLKKDGFEVGKTMAAVFLDRVISLLVLCIFAAAGVVFLMPSKTWMIAAMLLLILASLIAITSSIVRNFVKKALGRRARYFAGFYSALQRMLAYKNKLFLNFLLTNMQWQLSFLMVYFLFLAQGVRINYVAVMFLYAIIKVISLVPITMAGLGVKELFAIILFSSFSIAAENTMAVFTVLLITTYFIAFAILIVSALYKYNSAPLPAQPLSLR